MADALPLRYGMNPHQKTARLVAPGGALPVEVLSGAPGFINMLDALNAWALVRDLRAALDLPAAASFKHVSPAGAAVTFPLSEDEARALFVADMPDLSPLAVAYARARGADRMSSFGDFAAFSDPVDASAAALLKREVSDGCIAPAYDEAALSVLREKKGGKYLVLRIDPDYAPPATEAREVFGLRLEQDRNAAVPGPETYREVVTKNAELTEGAIRDLLVGQITLKYTQSNSVALCARGQAIGIGAGQQSRVHCTRLAAGKADTWWLRQHPRVLETTFREGLSRAEMNNAIDLYLLAEATDREQQAWREAFDPAPEPLTPDERRAWLQRLTDVTLASDAYFPFRDSIDRAARSGVRTVVQPGHSLRDDEVIAACDEYGMTMVFSGLRLFHH